MYTAIKSSESKRLRNNDPLAHIDIMCKSFDQTAAEARIKAEFITDMGERLRQPFNYQFTYTVVDGELMSDTNMSLTQLLADGLLAAKQDVAEGLQTQYHADRAAAFLEQQELILDWYYSDLPNNLLLASLCPPASELTVEQAQKQAFKPDRKMASMQMFCKRQDGTIMMHAFSIDNLDLPGLGATVDRLGGEGKIASSTLEQLLIPLFFDRSVDAAVFINANDTRMSHSISSSPSFVQGMDKQRYKSEANAFVESRPEVWSLYRSVVKEVAASLQVGRVSDGLADICLNKLAGGFISSNQIPPDYLNATAGEQYSIESAESLMQYLLNQAIPQYLITEMDKCALEATSVDKGGNGSCGIATAGATAIRSGANYQGSCPSSSLLNSTEQDSTVGERKALSQVYNTLNMQPKPILTKGQYEMIPIGSCPVCGSECGTGIRSKTSGKWYCTQDKCRAYSEDVYNFVLGINQEPKNKPHIVDRSEPKIYKTRINKDKQNLLNMELYNVQKEMAELACQRYSITKTQTERNQITNRMIEAYQYRNTLLRASLGNTASLRALNLENSD